MHIEMREVAPDVSSTHIREKFVLYVDGDRIGRMSEHLSGDPYFSVVIDIGSKLSDVVGCGSTPEKAIENAFDMANFMAFDFVKRMQNMAEKIGVQF